MGFLLYHTLQVLGFAAGCVGGIVFSYEDWYYQQHLDRPQNHHPYYHSQICSRALPLGSSSQRWSQNSQPFSSRRLAHPHLSADSTVIFLKQNQKITKTQISFKTILSETKEKRERWELYKGEWESWRVEHGLSERLSYKTWLSKCTGGHIVAVGAAWSVVVRDISHNSCTATTAGTIVKKTPKTHQKEKAQLSFLCLLLLKSSSHTRFSSYFFTNLHPLRLMTT